VLELEIGYRVMIFFILKDLGFFLEDFFFEDYIFWHGVIFEFS